MVLVDLLRRRLFVVTVRGASMEPGLVAGDRLLARRTSVVRPGQLVIVEAPVRDPGWAWRRGRLAAPAAGGWIVKRVAAVAGDPVPAWAGSAWAGPARAGRAGGRVPPGSLLVLGDNPAASIDSRELGFVPADRVLGVAVRRFPRRPGGNTAEGALAR